MCWHQHWSPPLLRVYKGLHTNNLMEDLAILYALDHSCALSWKRIICELDSQVVTLLIEQQLDDVNWHLVVVIRQILWLCGSLESVSFSHIPREGNWSC